MDNSEETITLCDYVIRPRSQDLVQVKKLQDEINKSLQNKKLLRYCGVHNSADPVVLVQTDNGHPALRITCSAELARLITNLPKVFRLEPNGFWEPIL